MGRGCCVSMGELCRIVRIIHRSLLWYCLFKLIFGLFIGFFDFLSSILNRHKRDLRMLSRIGNTLWI